MIHILMLAALAFIGMLSQSSKINDLEKKLTQSQDRIVEMERILGKNMINPQDEDYDDNQDSKELNEIVNKNISLIRKRMDNIEEQLDEAIDMIHQNSFEPKNLRNRMIDMEENYGELSKMVDYCFRWVNYFKGEEKDK